MQNIINSIAGKLVGIGYRHEIRAAIESNKAMLDCIEVISENYISNEGLCMLGKLAERFKIVLHGVNLSIASPFLDKQQLNRIKMACEISNATYYSEHLSLTKTEHIKFGHLAPVTFTEKVLELVVRNVDQVQEYLKIPLVLENITYPFCLQQKEMSETEFFQRLVKQTGCGILLDLANVYINSQNHKFDPYEFIDNIPLSNIVQVHLAGGFQNHHGVYIDSHSRLVNEGTWKLLEYVTKISDIKVIILEHDDEFPEDFSLLSNQLKRAKNLFYKNEINNDYATVR